MKDLAKEITKVNIEEELKKSYLDYAMSVIIGRALPDVRDGLKPVHRRILFAMNELKNYWNKPYKKSARIVGDVIGKYHPHGDSAVYDAIVRMAQSFSLRYPLIDGQGNFGSIDGDSAAAMRYTEIRMSKIAHEMLCDLDKNTVDFIPNYDETETIPEILPTKFPNLLVNGSTGIAVGMATNIPPHNLNEVINGCLAYIENNQISVKKIMSHIPGPDFPTSGIIYGNAGIEEAYRTGRGKICIRAKYFIEKNQKNKKESIIIQELPYQVNKAKLIEKIVFLIKEKKLDGISAIRDESDKEGMRIVIEIKKAAITKLIINKLYKLTSMQTSFGFNIVALSNGEPKVLPLKSIINEFIIHRKTIIKRKNKFILKKQQKKKHILEGTLIALENINKIINIIQKSKNNQDIKKILKKKIWLTTINTKQKKYQLDDSQITAIMEIKLSTLNSLEKDQVYQEYLNKIQKIKKITEILENKEKVIDIIKNELIDLKQKFSDSRKTKIIQKASEMNIEDIILKENVVVTLSHLGYVKYQPISDYNAQKRGGKGRSAAKTKDTDYIENLLVTNSHDSILCFSSLGIIYLMKVYQLPETSWNTRGKPIVNILPLTTKERITNILPVKNNNDSLHIFMATKNGFVKKTKLNQFKRPRNSGIIAINLRKNDELIGAVFTTGKDNIMLCSAKGKIVHFSEKNIRNMGRTASGVKGITLSKTDKLVSLLTPKKNENILIVTENGFGKRTNINEFPVKSRATKGVISIKITKKNGIVMGVIQVNNNDQIMMITNAGTLVRTRVSEIAILKRNTQGVILIRTTKNEKLVGLQKVTEQMKN